MLPKKKLEKLKKIILGMDSLLIAFSGGADSSFLLKVASTILPKEKLLAVTANSETYPKEELNQAKSLAKEFGVRHKIIYTYEAKDKRFIANPPERCYFCKKELFNRLQRIAKAKRFDFVADASNISDKNDFRPGSIAKSELKIRSPLQEAGLNKEEIRILSRSLGLETWDKPSLACLSSRIPYGTKISSPILKRIHNAEVFLKGLGFQQVRLRHYNGLCRIEVDKSNIPSLLKRSSKIVDRLKKLGYNYITLDLEGYRTGSMNEVIKK